MEKKSINNEKKICAEIWKGYCPNRIVRGGLYCNTKFVLQPRWLEGGWFKQGLYCSLRGKLYCNRLVYIAIEGGWKQGAVYCNTLHCIAT